MRREQEGGAKGGAAREHEHDAYCVGGHAQPHEQRPTRARGELAGGRLLPAARERIRRAGVVHVVVDEPVVVKAADSPSWAGPNPAHTLPRVLRARRLAQEWVTAKSEPATGGKAVGCGTTKSARQRAAERDLRTGLDVVVSGGEARRDAARHVTPR